MERVFVIASAAGFVLMIFSLIPTPTPHRHSLYELGLLTNFIAGCVVGAPMYRFIDRQFLPVYEDLVHLCAVTGVPCSIHIRRATWIFRLTAVSWIGYGLLATTREVLRDQHVLLGLVVFIVEIAAAVGLVFTAKSLKSIQSGADISLSYLKRLDIEKVRPIATRPPGSAKFLLLLVPLRHREHLIGDLDEEFSTIVLPEYGLGKARLWYWWQVTASLAPLLWAEIKRIAALVLLWKNV